MVKDELRQDVLTANAAPPGLGDTTEHHRADDLLSML